MKKLLLAATALSLLSIPAIAADPAAEPAKIAAPITAEVGKPAPDFSGTDVISNAPFKLSDHKGKIVVLEWTNHLCPFVVKHYESGNMQKVQKEAEAKGAEWISIVSSAPGRQGNLSAEKSKKITTDANAAPTAKILDEKGEIGHQYGADTTPDMVVIDKDGNIAYMGAIDDQPAPGKDTVEGAKNYVLAAVTALAEGKPVETPFTQSYGCAVKYAE